MDLQPYKHFQRNNWIVLGVALSFAGVLIIHFPIDYLLGRNAWFDLFFGTVEVMVGVFLIVLGYFQMDLLQS